MSKQRFRVTFDIYYPIWDDQYSQRDIANWLLHKMEDLIDDPGEFFCPPGVLTLGEKFEDYGVKAEYIPEEPEIEIWAEGFRATGEHGTATYFGRVRAPDLRQACIRFASDNPEFAKHFDVESMTYWGGCRLFDNEAEARKEFG